MAKSKGDNKKKKDAGGKEENGGDKDDIKLKPATSLNVRHILCEKHSKKEEALAMLRDGAKFDDVARDMSEDKRRQGGSLGWKVRGSLNHKFEEVAYTLEPSTTGNPKIGEVRTDNGYHIIMVEGRK